MRHVLPYYGRVEFITDETGNKKISNVIVNFGSLRIGDKKEGEEKSEEDNYEIEVSDSYFFLEESFIQVKKNNQVMARQTFFKGLPTSYVSYYDNENINISYSCVDGVPDGEYQSYHENGKLRVSCFFKNGALNGEIRKYDLEGKTKYLVPFVDGEIEEVIPITTKRLKILDPITLPIDISVCPVSAALMVTANSGAEVPNATTVSPTTKSDIFKLCAISAAESTSQSAPFQSMIIEMTTSKQSINKCVSIILYVFIIILLKIH